MVEARLGFLDRLERELVRDDREIGEAPFPALHIELARQAELDEMTDRGRDDVVLVLEVVLDLFETAERASEITGDAGFLRDDERLGHFLGGVKQRDFYAPAGFRQGPGG